MGCGCQGGSGAGGSGSTRRAALLKRPGYTWDGPESDDAEEAEEADGDEDDEG